MKTYNTKLAIRVFSAIAAFDAIVLILDHVLPDRWLIIPWWTVNFVGFPLAHYFVDMLPPSPASIICLLAGVGLLSASLWSMAAGYVFRRKNAA
ncbi:MAG TPA: hypothetical protein VIK28_04280 [Sedimentisphaerales bacterium]